MYFWEIAAGLRPARPSHGEKPMTGSPCPSSVCWTRLMKHTLLVPRIAREFSAALIFRMLKPSSKKAHKVGGPRLCWIRFNRWARLPVDVAGARCRFRPAGGVLKMALRRAGCGPICMFAPDLGKTLQPKLTGWFAHQNPFGFEVGSTRYADPSVPLHEWHLPHSSPGGGTSPD